MTETDTVIFPALESAEPRPPDEEDVAAPFSPEAAPEPEAPFLPDAAPEPDPEPEPEAADAPAAEPPAPVPADAAAALDAALLPAETVPPPGSVAALPFSVEKDGCPSCAYVPFSMA